MTDFSVKNFNEKMLQAKFPSYVLGADIGGTNTNLVIAGVENLKPVLLFSLNFRSKELDSLVPAVETTLAYAYEKYNIKPCHASIGAAGVVKPTQDYANLTNIPWNVSIKELKEKTSLPSAFIMNDFQAIGYGVNLLNLKNKEDFFEIRGGISHKESSRIVLGAGTGLGKSTLVYNEYFDAHLPIPSEGGHGDFPAQNNYEIKLLEFIKKIRGFSQPVTYEELLSGRGLESIYLFLRDTQQFKVTDYTEEIDETKDKAPVISKYKNEDETCKETFHLFTKFYARCAKNFVLDTMAIGGVYIAGGIASKNREIFKTLEFISEFENAYRRIELLKTVPIYVILNYDISLYGACLAAIYDFKKKSNKL